MVTFETHSINEDESKLFIWVKANINQANSFFRQLLVLVVVGWCCCCLLEKILITFSDSTKEVKKRLI